MALALILDRLGVDWKGAMMTSDKYPDEILAEIVPQTSAGSAGALARVMKEIDYEDLFKLVQEKTARISQERKLAADAFLKQEGVEILVRPPEAPVEVRGFDPLNIQVIDSTRAIHKRLLRLAFGESTFSASGVPVMVALGSGPFDIRTATVFIPADELQMEADLVPLPLEPGSRTFSSSLRLSGGGLTLQAFAGTLTVSPDRMRVEIALKR
jgi:hypothetical protein